MLKKLKFNEHLMYSKALGNLMTKHIKTYYNNQVQRPSLIMPVPLHNKRLKQRGFNQTIEIARYISKELKIPLDKYSLQRTKYASPQAQSTRQQRIKQVNNAFTIKKACSKKNIILLDDVITTGSTISACYNELKKHNINKIDIWSVAITN